MCGDYDQESAPQQNRLCFAESHSFCPARSAANVAFGDNGRAEFPDEDVVDAVYTAQANRICGKNDGYLRRLHRPGRLQSVRRPEARLSIAKPSAAIRKYLFLTTLSPLWTIRPTGCPAGAPKGMWGRHKDHRGATDWNDPGRGPDHRPP